MAYKSILTVTTAPEQATPAIRAAAALCDLHGAHLDLLALGVDRTQTGYSYVGSGAVVLQVALERAEEEARLNEAAQKAALAEQPATLRFGQEMVVTQLGALTDLVAQRARFADLVVLTRPYGPGRGPEAEAVIEAAMFEGAAPVLVVPDDDRLVADPRRVVIAWNQGREALAAIRHALPILKAADSVSITIVDPPAHGPERSDPGGLLCQMLTRHGVKAEVTVLARSLPRVSDVIARHARDDGADLIVMGAYGHSRFREAILGGATRNMLEQAEIPVLMAH